MAMTYTSLVAAKGTSGSIANWVSYTLLDLPPILDEAQALLYGILRCREMRTVSSFTMTVGASSVALPARFLDPIGRMWSPSINTYFRHKDENFVLQSRNFAETSGTLGANPFTATLGSTQVSCAFTAHGFNEGSTIYIAGASSVGGLTINGTFEIVSITTDAFVIETKADTAATSTATGGGSACTYTCQNIVQTTPCVWAVWDEKIKFEGAFVTQTTCQLQYFQSLPLLSSVRLTNFLTDRYPHLLRTACTAAAADFMQDTEEYNKCVARLTTLVQAVMVENDGMYRGAEIDAITPGDGYDGF